MDLVRTYGMSLELLRKPVSTGDHVFFLKESGHYWKSGSVVRTQILNLSCFIKIKANNTDRIVDRRPYAVARVQCHIDGLRSGKRVIAGKSIQELASGIIAESPAKHNKFRYLVFYDSGKVEYLPFQSWKDKDIANAPGPFILPIVWQSLRPWSDSRYLGPVEYNIDLVKQMSNFFFKYPRRLQIEVRINSDISIWLDEKIVRTHVFGKDCDIYKVRYKDGTEENIYSGSARLIIDRDEIPVFLKHTANLNSMCVDLLTCVKDYHTAGKLASREPELKIINDIPIRYSMQERPKPQICRKSTCSTSNKGAHSDEDNYSYEEYSEDSDKSQDIVTLTDEEILERHHECTENCLNIDRLVTETNSTKFKDTLNGFRDRSDLDIPMALGWSRKLRKQLTRRNHRIVVVYTAPCGKYIASYSDLATYFDETNSRLDVTNFNFDKDIETGLKDDYKNDSFIYFEDIAHENGKPLERKNIGLLNEYNEINLPQDYYYKSEVIPNKVLRDRGFTFNTEFKSGCDCEDNCSYSNSCKCQVLTREASGKQNKALYQYTNKRLPNGVISTGIYECNEFCKCDCRCPNRVVQNGLQFRLRIERTKEKGWGVYTLDDIPKGSFICTYKADLLDDANMYGYNDIYYADLDFLKITEMSKQELDEISDEGVASDDDETAPKQPQKKTKVQESNRKSNQQKKSNKKTSAQKKQEVKFKSIRSMFEHEEYTLDAKLAGNIGRFMNHSCDPNCQSQNVFIETHDQRLPNIAFFATKTIKAKEEIFWDYNYVVGSIPGRELICKCGSSKCRGRIL